MKLPTFLAIVATAAISVSGTTYTLNHVNASQTVPPPTSAVQDSPTQTTSTPTTEQAQAEPESVQFICSQGYDPATQEQVPITYAWTPKGKIAIVRWKSDRFAGSGFTPERRCSEVSPRFDSAYQNGNLNYLTNGRLNGQKAICAVRDLGADCNDNTLLLTLRPEDEELQVLSQLNGILDGDVGSGPLEQSTSPKHPDGTDKVYIELNVERFLATAPVEEE